MATKKRSPLGLKVKYDSKGRSFPCYSLHKPTNKETKAHNSAISLTSKRPSDCFSVILSPEEQAELLAKIEAKETPGFTLEV